MNKRRGDMKVKFIAVLVLFISLLFFTTKKCNGIGNFIYFITESRLNINEFMFIISFAYYISDGNLSSVNNKTEKRVNFRDI